MKQFRDIGKYSAFFFLVLGEISEHLQSKEHVRLPNQSFSIPKSRHIDAFIQFTSHLLPFRDVPKMCRFFFPYVQSFSIAAFSSHFPFSYPLPLFFLSFCCSNVFYLKHFKFRTTLLFQFFFLFIFAFSPFTQLVCPSISYNLIFLPLYTTCL